MNPLAKIIAVAYALIAVIAAGMLLQASVNFVNVTDATALIPRNFRASSLDVPRVTNFSRDYTAGVNVLFDNPSKVAVRLMAVEFTFHVDDRGDARPWFDSGKLSGEQVGLWAAFFRSRESGPIVEPGSSLELPFNFTTQSLEERIALSHTDPDDGLTYVVLANIHIVYTFRDFEVLQAVDVAPVIYGVTASG